MGYDIGPQIGIDGEAEFRRSIQQVNANIRTLGTEMARVTSEYSRNDKSQENLTKQNKVLNKQMDVQRQKILGLQQGLSESAKKYGENDVKTQKWKQSVNHAVMQLNKMDQQLQGNNVELAQMAEKSQDVERGLGPIAKKLEVLNSRFKMNTAALGENGTGLDGLKLKSENLASSMELQKQKVQTLEQAYKKSAESKGKDAEATQELEIRLNDAKATLFQTKEQLKSTNKEIEKQSNSWLKVGESMQRAGEQMKAVGKKIADVGKSLSMKVTAPIMGIGVASSKMAMDFDANMSEVQAISGATGDDLEALRQKALEMGRETSKTATESAQALKYMSLAGWDSKTSIEALEPVLRLSEAGAMDLALASDLVTDSMSALGINVEQLPMYLDQMAQTSRKSNTNIQQLGEAMVVAGGTFKNLKIPMEEANAVLGILANRGMKGTEAGNSLNSIMINLTTGAGKAGTAMAQLGVHAFDNEGQFKGMGNVLKEVNVKTKDMTEEQRNMYLAMIGGKTQLSTLQALLDGVGQEFDSLKGNIKDSNGALDEIAATMQDNFKGKMTELKSALEGAGISIGKSLIPMLTKLVAKIKELTDKFNSLSPAQQEIIVKVGMITAAIGPMLIMSGKIVGAMGAISTAFGASSVAAAGVTPAIAGLGTTFGAALIPILPWVAAIAGVTVAGIALYKHFSQKCIPAVKLFGEETAEGTKKAIGAYMELDKSVGQSLMNLKLTGATVSAETKDTLVNNFSQMGEQIKTGMDQQFNESFASLQTFFTNSTALTQEEEQKILEGAKAKNEAEKAEITAHTQQIQAILNAASANGRELTAQEMQEINSLQAQMKVNAVQSLSETEVESKAILERMRQQAEEMTAQQAVEVVKNSSEQKNKAVENANAQYDETIKAIIRQRDESGTISAEQAKKLIADAKLQRDESITSATEMHNGVIEQAKKQAGDHVSQVDWEKGEVKTKWTQMLEETTAKINAYTEHRKQMWKELGTATKQLCVEIKQGIVDVFTRLPKKIAEIGGNIVTGLWDGITNKTAWIKTQIGSFVDNVKGVFTGKKGFDTHSPSKWSFSVGKYVVDGFANGLSKTATKAEKAAEELSKGIMQKATSWVEDKKFYNELALADELSFWKEFKEMRELKGNELNQIDKKIYTIKQNLSKKSLEDSKKWIDNEVYYNRLSSKEIVAAWERVVKRKDLLHSEQLDAEKGLHEATNKMLEEQKKAFDAYEKSIDSRAKSLQGFAGIFDKIEHKNEVTGKELLSNLKGQVDGFKNWQDNIERLENKGVTGGLLDELREMGPKAAEQIQALTRLSENELNQYQKLFEEKTKLASDQAIKEIGPMVMPIVVENDKEMNAKNGETTRSIAGNIVTDLQVGMENNLPQITDVSERISSEVIRIVKTFNQQFVSVGANITKGIWKGIESGKSGLINNIISMLREAVRAAKKEMDINSPSRVWAKVGGFMAEGLGVGFLEEMVAVSKDINASIPVPRDIFRNTNTNNSNGKEKMEKGGGDFIVNIEKIENSNGRTTEDFCNEVEFYRRQRMSAKGGVFV